MLGANTLHLLDEVPACFLQQIDLLDDPALPPVLLGQHTYSGGGLCQFAQLPRAFGVAVRPSHTHHITNLLGCCSRRGVSMTRPGTLLKHQVAIKTFADWSETAPGFVEVDLVAHCGCTGAGPFLYTLTLVDVATGWVSCAGLRDKRAQTVLAALHGVHEGLPFKILGLDSDNGSEFLNKALLEYCEDQHITFTRGRPYRKNDSCFVELCGHPHNSALSVVCHSDLTRSSVSVCHSHPEQ